MNDKDKFILTRNFFDFAASFFAKVRKIDQKNYSNSRSSKNFNSTHNPQSISVANQNRNRNRNITESQKFSQTQYKIVYLIYFI